MKLNRRDFLKVSTGAAATAGLLLVNPSASALAQDSQTQEGKAMLVDVTKCISCWACYIACKEYNGLSETISIPDPLQPPTLASDTWTTLHTVNDGGKLASRKLACNHCTDAACVKICPTGALSYNDMGFVQLDRNKCSGCGYCAEVCPFDVPQLESNSISGDAKMYKCTFCKERVTEGDPPACAAACPTGAITYGNRGELAEEGLDRVNTLINTNPNAVLYGEKELGGLHVMYVLDDSPDIYGLPADPSVPASVVAHNVIQWVGAGAAIAVVAGLGLNYLVSRARIAREGEGENE